MFRLLPVQVLLAASGTLNSIISSYFASNYVGTEAMSAVGLYGPLNMFFGAVSLMLVSGAAILCGEYLGRNEQDKLQNTFSAVMVISVIIGAFFAAALAIEGIFDLTGFLTKDMAVRPFLDGYLEGQAIGLIPLFLSAQLASFLFIENKGRITQIAGFAYLISNLLLNLLFVRVLHMEAFGLSLASSLGTWVFLLTESWYFLSGRSHFRLTLKGLSFREIPEMLRIGLPGALTNVYQTLRGLAVNRLIEVYVGTVGISAFASANNLLSVFWAFPLGMLAVSRMLISISIGEEDRKDLTEVMRVALTRYVPMMCVISALVMVFAEPLTHIFFKDPSDPVYMMTVWGFRILPLCLPLAIPAMHYVCYGQASSKQALIHTISVLDGFVLVTVFTMILIPRLGMNSVYIANVLNGVFIVLIIIAYAWLKQKRFPRDMESFMVIPDDFGIRQEDSMNVTLERLEDVGGLSERIQDFCIERGIDERRAHLAGLAIEEMSGISIMRGYTYDSKKHFLDIRIACKNGDVIMRMKDDFVPFDPAERMRLATTEDIESIIGLRIVFYLSSEIKYQSILGLNALTIWLRHSSRKDKNKRPDE